MNTKFLKRISVLLVTIVVLCFSMFAMLDVQAAVDTSREIEVTIAADPVSNNLDLNGFSDLLKSKLYTMYGIPTDKVHVNVSESAAVSSSINWNVFDHTNYSQYATDTQTSRIDLFGSDYSNLMRNNHIVMSGSVINFYGYGSPAYKDFLFAPNNNANNKIFKFTLDEKIVDYHTAEGAGFLFNAKYTYNSNSDRRLSGYVVLIGSSTVNLYRLDNIDINSFKNEQYYTISNVASSVGSSGSMWGGTVYNIAAVSKPSPSSGTNRYLKLVASPTAVSFYQFTDTTYGTVKNKIFDNIALSTSYNTFGFGPIAAYSSHGCSSLTNVAFSDLQMSEDNSVSFAELVKSISWSYPGSFRVVANVDNDGVPDFGSTPSLSTILYYMLNNNAHYVGWGMNNAISIGGYNSVSTQANGFISRNNGLGTFIDRSNSSTDSLDEGATALAVYIGGQLNLTQTIDKPVLTTSFLGDGSVTVATPTTLTSLGNPIATYQWRYIDVANGTWQNYNGNSYSSSFSFAAGTYNYVSLRIQDSVTMQWSDYAISYVARDTNAPPIAQYEFNTNELMPDTSILSLRTGTVVTATDYSYHPAGEALTNWEWKVYNSVLVEQSDMAKTYTSTTIPSNLSFDFAGKPAGTYTVKLRVKKGSSNWSSNYEQNITIFKESSTVTITPTNPPAGGQKSYLGTETIQFGITSSNSTITGYRIIKSPLSGGDNIVGDWNSANTSSLNGTGSISGGSYDVYVQAKDALGNSKTQLIGRYLMSYTVTFKDFNGSTLKTETVVHGNAATPPDNPSRLGYNFTGWSTSYNSISSNTVITAQYSIITVNITITATPNQKTYGELDPSGYSYTITSGNLLAGIPLNGTLVRVSGEGAGVYFILQNNLTQANNPNYIITYVGANFTINKKALTITANDKSKTYGENDPTFTVSYSGFINNDTSSVISGLSIIRANGQNAGTYAITPSGAIASNYSITFYTGTMSINKKAITITSDNKAKNYGDDDPAFTATYAGLAYGETSIPGLVINRVTGQNVGTYTITSSGASQSNYSITYYTGTMTINKKAITITADNKSKKYGDNDPSLTATYNGLVYGEESVTGLVLTRVSGQNTGDYTITASGASQSNYSITYFTGKLTIQKKSIIVKADNKVNYYGDSDPLLTATFTSLAYGETTIPGITLQRASGVLPGDYTITASGCIESNYSITYQTGVFTIQKRILTITAKSKNKTYGQLDPVHEAIYEGFVNNDNASTIGEIIIYREVGEAAGTYSTNILILDEKINNYEIHLVSGVFTIEKKHLNIFNNQATGKIYNGDSNTTASAELSGIEAGDDVVLALENIRFANKNAGIDKPVFADQYLTGNDAANYELDELSIFAYATIDKRDLTLSDFTVSDKVYDGTTSVSCSFRHDFLADDDIIFNLSIAFASKNIGEDIEVVLRINNVAGDDAGNYNLLTPVLYDYADIKAKRLTIQGASASNKIYDGNATAIITGATLTGVVPGEDVSLVDQNTGLFGQKNIGTNLTITSDMRITGTDIGNYIFEQPVLNKADIYAKTLYVTGAVAQNKQYDGTAAAPILGATLNGVIKDETVTLINGSEGVFSNINVGNSITVTSIMSLAGADSSNYVLIQPTLNSANITKRNLDVIANNNNKIYGQIDPGFSITYIGFANGEGVQNLSGNVIIWRRTGENAGQYEIRLISTLASSNYSIRIVYGVFTVQPKELTIINATAGNKIYDGNTNAIVSGATLAGIINNDQVILGNQTAGLFINSTAGNGKTVTTSMTLSGEDAFNYVLKQPDLTANIEKRVISVTADSKSKIYGDSDPTFTYEITNGYFIGNDGLTGGLIRESGSNVGHYTILQGDLNTSGNYEIEYIEGTLEITKKALTISADDKTKVYGETDPTLTVSYDGFANGDSSSAITGLSISRATGENAGEYSITASGATSGNYSITFETGTLEITKKALTITADDKTKVYGETDPTLTVSYDGFANGDSSSAITGLSINRATGENAGEYTITASGATSGNYSITFETGALSITKKALTISADDKTKVYGETDPTLTVSYDGFANGDSSSAITGLSINRATGENAGDYTITASGATSGNYSITFETGALSITKKALTISADDKTKVYGETDPTLTVSYDGFANGDSSSAITGLSINRATGENAGDYTITASGATSGNYSITFETGALSITKKALTISADDKTKVYGETDPTLTVSYDGFANGDSSSAITGLSINRATGENAGDYTITASGATSGNYSITFETGTFLVDKTEDLVVTPKDEEPAKITNGDIINSLEEETAEFNFDKGNIDIPVDVLVDVIGKDIDSTIEVSLQESGIEKTEEFEEMLEETGKKGIMKVFDLSMIKKYSDGTEEYIHEFSGKLKISVKLTDAQIAAIEDVNNYDIYYYNELTKTFVAMNATYDASTKSMVFYTNHFSTYVLGLKLSVNPTTSDSFPSVGWFLLLTISCMGIFSSLLMKKKQLNKFML